MSYFGHDWTFPESYTIDKLLRKKLQQIINDDYEKKLKQIQEAKRNRELVVEATFTHA